MTRLEQAQHDCPGDVVDRLLWRNAQAILGRHVIRPDGTCQWCGAPAPCSPRAQAERADVVSRLPGREAGSPNRGPVHDGAPRHNEPTRMLPLLTADSALIRGGRTRNRRSYS